MVAHRSLVALAMVAACGHGDRRPVDAVEARAVLTRMEERQNAGDYVGALELAVDAERLATRAGHTDMRVTAALAVVSMSLELGDLRGAERALARLRVVSARGAGVATVRFDQAVIAHYRGRTRVAAATFDEAAALARDAGDVWIERAARYNQVETLVEAGEIAAAREALGRVPPPAVASVNAEAADLYHRALVAVEDGGEDALALVDRGLALEVVDDWVMYLATVGGDAAERRGDLAGAETRYARAADAVERLRDQTGYDELKAWVVAERRAPFEALFEVRAARGDVDGAIEAAERIQARSILDRIAAVDAPGARTDALATVLPSLRRSATATPRRAAELRAASHGRALWSYLRARDHWWLIAIADGEARVTRLGDDAAVAPLVDRFVADLDDAAAADALGAALIPDVALPASGRPIFVVTDGALAAVPFAALRRGGAPLVASHAIAHEPSLGALLAIEERAAGIGGALVLGDPRGDLPDAAQEARDVAARLGVEPRTGAAATAAGLEAAELLHLSTHAGNGEHGAYLALADGDVTAGRIVELHLAARLVVLATCASAGRVGPDHWGTLSSAFLAAGARGVVATLRSVEDAPARRFVADFYDHDGARAPMAAVAAAQRAALDAGRPAHEWATFIYLGGSDEDDAGDRDAAAAVGLRQR